MTSEQRATLKAWQRNFQVFLYGHYEAATECQRMNLRLGVPVVVLSAIVGTSIFSAVATDPSPRATVVVGGLSLSVAVLAALQTFLRYPERAEKHRLAGASFGALHKKIDQLLVVELTEGALNDALTSIRTRWDQLSQESPTIPRAIWARSVARYDPKTLSDPADGGLRGDPPAQQADAADEPDGRPQR